MSFIKKIVFVIIVACIFTLLSPAVFAGNSQPTFNEPEPVYHTIYPNMLSATTLPRSTENYYKEIRQKVDSVLEKKIKKKLYNEVFREDLLQEIYD
ncbi:MAG: hypothetical protein ABII18_06755, partial [bacterium]